MATRTETRTYTDWIGRTAYDRDGNKIGDIDNIYLDNETGRPEWLSVKTGWFGMSSSFAPIVGTGVHEDGIRIDADQDTIKDAPNVGEGSELSEQDEIRLYDHYGIDRTGGRDAYVAEARRGRGYDVGRRADEGYDLDEAAITRREEELDVHTHREEAGRVRLRKYVTTEQETVTVPVEKERVVVEREPATGTGTGAIGEEEAEVTVSEDRIDVDKRVVDKETVRAGRERETGQEQVQADLRREHVEVEGDADRR